MTSLGLFLGGVRRYKNLLESSASSKARQGSGQSLVGSQRVNSPKTKSDVNVAADLVACERLRCITGHYTGNWASFSNLFASLSSTASCPTTRLPCGSSCPSAARIWQRADYRWRLLSFPSFSCFLDSFPRLLVLTPLIGEEAHS